MTAPMLHCLLPASGPQALDTHPLCQGPAGQPKTTQGESYWKGRGIKCCLCHKAKFPLTLQTSSLLISSSAETSSHCHTLAGPFYLGYKSAPSSMVRWFSQEFPGQPPNSPTKGQSHALTYLTVPPNAHPLYACINSLHILSFCIYTKHSAFL